VDQVWAKQMFTLGGEDWKHIRSTFSPIFTSGKLKGMVSLLEGITEHLTKEVGKYANSGEMLELKETFGKFSMDSIASCAFGVEAQSFTSSGESQFVKNAKGIFRSLNLHYILMCKQVHVMNLMCNYYFI
jgi:cytochrome P450